MVVVVIMVVIIIEIAGRMDMTLPLASVLKLQAGIICCISHFMIRQSYIKYSKNQISGTEKLIF